LEYKDGKLNKSKKTPYGYGGYFGNLNSSSLSSEDKRKLMEQYSANNEKKAKANNEKILSAIVEDRNKKVNGDNPEDYSLKNKKPGDITRKEDPEKEAAKIKHSEKDKKINNEGYLSRFTSLKKEIEEAYKLHNKQNLDNKVKELKLLISEIIRKVRSDISDVKGSNLIDDKNKEAAIRFLTGGLDRFTQYSNAIFEITLHPKDDPLHDNTPLLNLFGNLYQFIGFASSWNELRWTDRMEELRKISKDYSAYSVTSLYIKEFDKDYKKDDVLGAAKEQFLEKKPSVSYLDVGKKIMTSLGLDPNKKSDIRRFKEELRRRRNDKEFIQLIIETYLRTDDIMEGVTNEFTRLTHGQELDILNNVRAYAEMKMAIQSDAHLFEKLAKEAPEALMKDKIERDRYLRFAKEQAGEEFVEDEDDDNDGIGSPPSYDDDDDDDTNDEVDDNYEEDYDG